MVVWDGLNKSWRWGISGFFLKHKIEKLDFCAIAKFVNAIIKYERILGPLYELAARLTQRFSVVDHQSELKRVADIVNVDALFKLFLREQLESSDVVFVGDHEQLARRHFERLVEGSGVNVANELLDDVSIKVFYLNALLLCLLHVGSKHSAKNGRANRE